MRNFHLTDVRLRPKNADESASRLIESVAKIGTWHFDAERNECLWSQAIYQMYGVPESLAYVPDNADFFLDGSHQKIDEALSLALVSQQSWDIEAPFLAATGQKIWVRSTGQTQKTASGVSITGCLQDVTEHHRLREEALANQRFVETILDNIPHMIFVKEAIDLRFVKFNKAGERLLGLASKDLLGRNDYDLFPKDQADHFVAKDRQTIENRLTLDIPEETIDTAHGQRLLHTKKITVVGDDDQPLYLLGISEDVTERKTQQETIEQQRVALTQAARLSALGEMAGGIAHEINNPLAIILGIGEQIKTILTEPTLNPARLAVLSDRLQTTVQRIAKIVAGLRDFSRDGEGDPFESVELRSIVVKTLALCAEKFRAQGVMIDYEDLPPDLTIRCQPVRFSQVLINLFNNAFDAMRNNADKVKRLVIAAETTAARRVEVRVSDTGPGIPADVVSKIMIPFFTTKPVGQGTGLGLSIARGICETHGGHLAYQGDENGAIFIISLPAEAQVKVG